MFRTRLTAFLATLAATACARELDDEACLFVELGVDCPSVEAAETDLVGSETCESPMRRIVATGELLSTDDVVCTGYGSCEPYEGTTPTSTTGTGEAASTRCCYEAAYRDIGGNCVIGRPLQVGGQAAAAAAVGRSDWGGAGALGLGELSAEERAATADAWTRAALLEHASVPAFARVILDLVALGAPAELVARTAAAMADEVEHASLSFAIASACAGRPVGPGPLPTPARRRATLTRLAVETLREACVGETLAVGVAAAQLAEARAPAVRAALGRIVADESRHAELAWDTLRWALGAGGPRVRAAVRRELARVPVPAEPVLARMLAEVVVPEAEAALAA